MVQLVATCAPGLEDALALELGRLLDRPIEKRSCAVAFEGDVEAAYRACLWSRVATRILWPLRVCYAHNPVALYAELRRIAWREHLGVDSSLAVHFVGENRGIRNSQFGAQKVKDAIVDALREEGRRPSVDLAAPDVRVHVALRKNRATVSIDLSGDPLHLRGHDRDGGAAPLKETLAAGILWLAGVPELDPEAPIVDPCCGSGTLLIEAAAMRRQIAPGLSRRRWGFERWRGHDGTLWERLVDEARGQIRASLPPRIFGGDRDAEQLARAHGNAARAGVADDIRFVEQPLSAWTPPGDRPGLLITNPPYGERLGDRDEVRDTWRELGDVLRQRFAGWTAWAFAGSPKLAREIGLRPSRRISLRNGALEGRLIEVPIADRAPERLL